MNITLRQLRVFQSVVACQNFTKGGEAVGLSQSAVSRCITELEDQLGLKVLDRTTREVALTQAGSVLAHRLGRVLDELDALLLDTQGLATSRRGTVRVASSPTLSANLMPQCIAACARAHPGLELVLLDRIQQEALAAVQSGEVDFGVVIEPEDPQDLHVQVIRTEPFCLVVPRQHVLAAQQRVRWGALSRRPLVLLDHASGSRRLIDGAFRKHGVDATVAQEVGHPTTIFRMVEEGLGIAVVPQLAIPPAGLGEQLVVQPLTPRIERRVMLVRRKSRFLSPLSELAWSMVVEVAQHKPAG